LHWHKSAIAVACPKTCARGGATLIYQLPKDQNGWFVVYDILSQKKLRLPVYYGIHELKFSCNQLNAGLYYYKIISSGNIISTGSFSTVK
jgi:hypothetical protein